MRGATSRFQQPIPRCRSGVSNSILIAKEQQRRYTTYSVFCSSCGGTRPRCRPPQPVACSQLSVGSPYGWLAHIRRDSDLYSGHFLLCSTAFHCHRSVKTAAYLLGLCRREFGRSAFRTPHTLGSGTSKYQCHASVHDGHARPDRATPSNEVMFVDCRSSMKSTSE